MVAGTFIVGDNQGNDPEGLLAQSNGNKGSVLYVQDAGYSVSGQPSYQKQFSYTYSSAGQKLTETNLNGVVTQYSYGDQWGNLTQVVQDPGTGHLNRTTSMVYDVAGHVLQSTDPANQTSLLSYNDLGQPLTAQFPAKGSAPAEAVSYQYDNNGRTSQVSDNRGATVMSYEAGSDRVSSVQDPITGTVSYTYGVSGERKTMTLPGSYQTGETGTNQWTYAYDTTHAVMPGDSPDKVSFQLTSITDDQGRRVNYALDPTGKPSQVKFDQTFDGGGNPTSYAQTDYTYDQSNGQNPDYPTSHEWLVTLRNSWNYKDGNGTWHNSTLVSNGYTIDNIGQRLTNLITSSDGSSRTEVYGYDPTNRLTSVDYGDGQTQSYAFDPMGNRLSKSDSVNGNEAYTYDNANRLLTRGSNSYANDIDGNTLTGAGRTNVWDSENRLVSCTYNGTSSSYTYGSDGLRRRATVAGTTTDFVLDATMQVRELHGGVDTATYLVGTRGPEYRRDDGTGAVRWYLFDGLGSVLGELDPAGNITASRKFDVYGGVRSSTGAPTSKHKFCGSLGHPSDDESGLIYMRARYMDPVTGRFLTQDPKEAGKNWFAYVRNNPSNGVDPTGLITMIDLFWGDVDSADVNAAAARMAQEFGSWAEDKIGEALARWAVQIGDEIWADELEEVEWAGDNLRIVGEDGRWQIRLDFSGHGGTEPHFNLELNGGPAPSPPNHEPIGNYIG